VLTSERLPPPGLLLDFALFAEAMMTSGDIDPAYPVLAHLVADMSDDDAAWLVYLYLTFYDLTSALLAFDATGGHPGDLPHEAGAWRTGIERRGLRGGKVRGHIDDVLAYADLGFARRFTAGFGDDPIVNWLMLDQRIRAIPGNGRWAGYKAGDLWRYCLKANVQAPGVGAEHASGPAEGVAYLYDVDPAAARSPTHADHVEALAVNLLDALTARGIGLGIDNVETLLCDFNSLRNGRYYVGHDTDLMLERLDGAPDWAAVMLLDAREAALPHEYLGELGGWPGVDRPRCRVYRDTRAILTRSAPESNAIAS
jgi:hypothetical protein